MKNASGRLVMATYARRHSAVSWRTTGKISISPGSILEAPGRI